MCVKCQPDGELPAGRKAFSYEKRLAVHTPHPAATHRQRIYLLCVALRKTTAKEVFL